MIRKMCSARDYYDGTVDLARIAELNEILDVVDENDRRQGEAQRRLQESRNPR